jgi:hypothetical protein
MKHWFKGIDPWEDDNPGDTTEPATYDRPDPHWRKQPRPEKVRWIPPARLEKDRVGTARREVMQSSGRDTEASPS